MEQVSTAARAQHGKRLLDRGRVGELAPFPSELDSRQEAALESADDQEAISLSFSSPVAVRDAGMVCLPSRREREGMG